MSTLSTTNIKHPSSASNNIVLDSSARVLVGTATSALEKVVIKGDGGGLQINRNDSGSPTSDQALGSIGFKGVVSANSNSSAEVLIQAAADENHSGSTAGSRLEFHTKPSGTGPGSSPTERMRLDSSGNLKFNSGYGSVATAYGCRAWINFDGTSGSIGTGRASGNISSVTDNGTGDYTLNFSNAMPDANYAAIGSASNAAGGVIGIALIPDYPNATQTTSSLRVESVTTATNNFDAANFYVAIFR